MANSHRRNNIVKLRINGEWVTREDDFRLVIVNAFKNLLFDPRDWRANPEGLDFSRLDELEAGRLELPFLVEEVYAALLQLNGDKALGPDDYIAAFWQFSYTSGFLSWKVWWGKDLTVK